MATGMFRSCLGAQPAPAARLALAQELLCVGHPSGTAPDRKPSTVHYRPQGLQGNPTIQQLKAMLWHFYINLSLILNLSSFSCIECVFCDHYFCPHIQHTHSRSLLAPWALFVPGIFTIYSHSSYPPTHNTSGGISSHLLTSASILMDLKLFSSYPSLMLSSFPLLQLCNHSNATSCSSGLHSFALTYGQQLSSRIKRCSESLLTTVLHARLPSGRLFNATFSLYISNWKDVIYYCHWSRVSL